MLNSLKRRRLPTVGLLWPQFAPYHVDRCEAAAERLGGKASIVAVEVATSSETYAWSPSGDVRGVRKLTLFPGTSYESISVLRMYWREFQALRHCDMVLIGVSYGRLDVALLAYSLRLIGVKMVMMTESKFDDRPRTIERELVKLLVFAPYSGAIVGGSRQSSYMRFLGYRRRRVVPGYDTVNLDRVRAMGGGIAAPGGTPFADRPFVFVGRFVAKKNLFVLLDAYRRYCDLAGPEARRLLLVGSGQLEEEIRARIVALDLGDRVEIPGFLQAEGVAGKLAGALALILPSIEEQWGLVVNEALAFSLPVITSENVGSRDFLVRNLVNGYVVEAESIEGFAQAMLATAASEEHWRAMVGQSHTLAPLAHSDRFGEAVEAMLAR